MGRSLKKGPFVDHKLQKKVQVQLSSGKKNSIKTWSRASAVSPEMVGLKFLVHNGKDFSEVFILENMVGHKLGEFAPTRKFRAHGGRMAKEQAMAAAEAERTKVVSAQESGAGAKPPATK